MLDEPIDYTNTPFSIDSYEEMSEILKDYIDSVSNMFGVSDLEQGEYVEVAKEPEKFFEGLYKIYATLNDLHARGLRHVTIWQIVWDKHWDFIGEHSVFFEQMVNRLPWTERLAQKVVAIQAASIGSEKRFIQFMNDWRLSHES
jgi:hypothetical protein